MQHVFVYGSLLFPEIVEGLTGCKFATQEASLQNYLRCAVKENDYPAIIKKNECHVKGKVLLNVDEQSFELLRFFEGSDYHCAEVIAESANEKWQACAFVWSGKTNELEENDWNPQVFELNALADYVRYVVPETVEAFERLFS